MDERDELEGTTLTTPAGLMDLASVIEGMVREGAIDTRFGGKLLKRLEKEARRLIDRGPGPMDEAQHDALFAALGECERELRRRDAALLVEANARLRDAETPEPKPRKKKDAQE